MTKRSLLDQIERMLDRDHAEAQRIWLLRLAEAADAVLRGTNRLTLDDRADQVQRSAIDRLRQVMRDGTDG